MVLILSPPKLLHTFFFLSFPTLLDQLTFPLCNSAEISRLWMSNNSLVKITKLNKQRLKETLAEEIDASRNTQAHPLRAGRSRHSDVPSFMFWCVMWNQGLHPSSLLVSTRLQQLLGGKNEPRKEKISGRVLGWSGQVTGILSGQITSIQPPPLPARCC